MQDFQRIAKTIKNGKAHGWVYKCIKCSYTCASSASANKHINSEVCLQAQIKEEMDKLGKVPIGDNSILSAVIKAGITVDKKPTKFIYFIDRWAFDAIKEYYTRDQYAGLTLSEFLTRLNGSSNAG